MKNFILKFGVIALATCCYGCEEPEVDPEGDENVTEELIGMDLNYKVMNLTNMSESEIQSFFSGETPSLAVEIPAGLSLPFSLSIQGQFLATQQNNPAGYNIVVAKTCYVRCLSNTFIFSCDLQNWSSFENFFTGCINVSLNVDDGTPSFGLNIDLNQKI